MLTDSYFEYLKKDAGLSENTVNSYRYDIEGFYAERRRRRGNDAKTCEIDITRSDILSYILHMKDSGRSTATILRGVAAVKNYCRYLEQCGYISENPCEGIELPRQEKRAVQKPASNEIIRLLNSIKKDSIKGMRDYAMICLVAKCGMQASEMIAIDTDNFRVEENEISVAKNGGEQTFSLPAEVTEAIENYITKCRPLIVNENEKALFLNASGRRMTRQGFWKIVRQYKDKASIDVEITPRTLRYSLPG